MLRDDWIGQYLPDCFEEVAENVVYTASGTSPSAEPQNIKAIFHRDYISLKVSGGMAVESSKPAFIVQDSDVPTPKKGDKVSFDGTDYFCVEIARTRGGVTVLLMDRGS